VNLHQSPAQSQADPDLAMLPGQCVIALGEQIPRCFVTSSGIPIQVSLTESRMHSALASAATSTRPPAGRELDGTGEKVSQDLSDQLFVRHDPDPVAFQGVRCKEVAGVTPIPHRESV
jgi:hypothetical protein